MQPIAQFFVCEKDGSWAAAFRRAARHDNARVREVRSLAELDASLDVSPYSVAAVDALAFGMQVFGSWLGDFRRQHPHAIALVLGTRELQSVEWQLRELGASHLIVSTRQLDAAWKIAERYLESAPAADLDWKQEMWTRLPWSEHGTLPASE